MLNFTMTTQNLLKFTRSPRCFKIQFCWIIPCCVSPSKAGYLNKKQLEKVIIKFLFKVDKANITFMFIYFFYIHMVYIHMVYIHMVKYIWFNNANWTNIEYLNDAKCANMIRWPLKFNPVIIGLFINC